MLKIKAHELRALSASWSYMNKIPIEDIIKAAVWSSRSTFAKFYLRDLNTPGENLRLMGPVVSAQKVVGASQVFLILDANLERLSSSKTDSKVLGYDSAVSRDRVVEI